MRRAYGGLAFYEGGEIERKTVSVVFFSGEKKDGLDPGLGMFEWRFGMRVRGIGSSVL